MSVEFKKNYFMYMLSVEIMDDSDKNDPLSIWVNFRFHELEHAYSRLNQLIEECNVLEWDISYILDTNSCIADISDFDIPF